MLPTLPVWQTAHGFGSEQDETGNSMALQLICLFDKIWFFLESSSPITLAQVVAGYQGDLRLWFHGVLGSTTQKISGKDDKFIRHLVAAAAAYISVIYRGRVSGTCFSSLFLVEFL